MCSIGIRPRPPTKVSTKVSEELEAKSDAELAADQFEHLARVLRDALAADAEKTMDVIAAAGLVVEPSEGLRRMHRHAG